MVNDILFLADQQGYGENKGSFIDSTGNIRVLKVLWRSQKLIKKIKYYDEYGATQYKIRSEEYVADEMMGEEEESDDPDSFTSKSPFQRLCILVAGPFMNFVLAFLICKVGQGMHGF